MRSSRRAWHLKDHHVAGAGMHEPLRVRAHVPIRDGDDNRATSLTRVRRSSVSRRTRSATERVRYAASTRIAFTETRPTTIADTTTAEKTQNAGWCPRRARRWGWGGLGIGGRVAGARAGATARRRGLRGGRCPPFRLARGEAHAASPMRSAARSLALRARGLRAVSSGVGRSGFFVRMRRRSSSRNARFTMPSSKE